MNIPVARLWHKRGKLEYHCIKQLLDYFPGVNFEWHVVLDKPDYSDEWSAKIDKLPTKITWYTTTQMLEYAKQCDYLDDQLAQKIPNFVHFYHIIIFHYLRRVLQFDYALAYEYDIIFNSDDLEELRNCIVNKIPFGILEPINGNCDKALHQKLSALFGVDILSLFTNNHLGINAGFQGMNLKLFDNFMNPSAFKELLNCFDFSGIYADDGVEKVGWERTIIDTQEQSFHSLMNRAASDNFKILTPDTYYFLPSYVDLDLMMKSKVLHFFGHTKPNIMLDLIDERLNNNL